MLHSLRLYNIKLTTGLDLEVNYTPPGICPDVEFSRACPENESSLLHLSFNLINFNVTESQKETSTTLIRMSVTAAFKKIIIITI